MWIIGAEDADGETWYEVVLDVSFIAGWISGGSTDDGWLAPFDPAGCPDSFSEALAEGDPIVGSMRQLACFGDRQIGAVVYWLPDESQEGVPCPWPDLEPAWLICYEWVNATGAAEREAAQLAVYGTQDRDDVRRGEWVTLIGHYDDARSVECPESLDRDPEDQSEAAATILFCRTRFVLDEVRDPVAP